ncbi:hypothetical protein QTO34_016244 [Cnephaeus nilssonii]|uniref:Thyroglobulin type-1 domain-containing protein n=2 Tax=Laurasiatheria TaxID=314145 RepID=A0AA40I5Q6_CNENI|nr:hypothetical protein QTO34_016244 [Eptesicus nilssonii]
MEDQRDLISNHEQLPMLGQRPGAQESKCSRGALYTGFSVLVALLLAGQATTAYFLYQQQGRLDKLTVTSQNLQLENLRMKLPNRAPPHLGLRSWAPDRSTLSPGHWGHTHAVPPDPTAAKPVGKMRVATPMLMQALPMEDAFQGPMRNATKYGNTTLDHVMHLLLKADPLKVYPQMKGSFPENLKHLKNTMEGLDWKIFESWMHQWLLFEMSKNSLEEKLTEGSPKVLTKCLEEASRIPAIHPGSFKPQCDENGNYMPLQCFGSIGYCWCVFPNGTEVPHTRSRGRHNCSEPLDMEDLSSGLGVTKQDLAQEPASPPQPLLTANAQFPPRSKRASGP